MSEPSRNKTKHSRLFAIAGAGVVLTLPVLIFGIPFLSDDASFHSIWYSHFSKQLWSGDLYPRWLMEMNGGLGSPVFFFYPPAPYFLTSLLRPLFPNDPTGLHQLGIAASAALIASGLTAYLWLRNLADPTAALIAAILYMAMPYHLAADLYVRASFAEYWTFVWMPLILYFVHRLAAGRKLAVVGMAISWALLMMTHLPTTLMFSIVPFCYALWLAPENKKLRMLGLTFVAAVLGVGLAAIYLAPALTTQQFVLVSKMTTGYFSYANWLFFAKFSLWKEDKVTMLLLVADMLAVATCAFIIVRSTRHSQTKKLGRFWFALVILSALMMTQLSKPVWLAVPPLQRIQFPWRFNTLVVLATAALLAMAISGLKTNRSPALFAAKLVGLVLMIVWIPATVWKASTVFPQTNPVQRDIAIRQEELDQSRDPPEYRPRWSQPTAAIDWEASVDEELWIRLMKTDIESLLQRAGSSTGHPPQPKIIEGNGVAEIKLRKPGEIDLIVNSATGMKVTVPQFYYPYWTARLSGEAIDLAVTPSQPDGLIDLSVPAGNHLVQLQLKRSAPEQIGMIISLISLIGVAVFACFATLREKFFIGQA